jgi:hypothetical protein
MTVRDLILLLQEMPKDFEVFYWDEDQRVSVDSVVNVGNVVDLYHGETE